MRNFVAARWYLSDSSPGSKILGLVRLLHVPNSIRFWDMKVLDLRDIILGLVRFHNRHHELSDFHVMYFVPTY